MIKQSILLKTIYVQIIFYVKIKVFQTNAASCYTFSKRELIKKTQATNLNENSYQKLLLKNT